ncbi:MAG: carboxymuconolactone decarboxylase family protein [Blastocatellia bacterium]
MESRIDYNKVDPGAAKAMYGLEAYVKKSGLESSLIELVKLRASQINGCAFCIDMSIEKFLQWQWSGYSAAHQNRTNLLLHLVAVPLFMSATLLAVYALVGLSLPALAAAAICFLVSLILQGRGHKLEAKVPEPFKGGLDFIVRLFAEQWITFPRFVLTGGWLENLSKTATRAASLEGKRERQN